MKCDIPKIPNVAESVLVTPVLVTVQVYEVSAVGLDTVKTSLCSFPARFPVTPVRTVSEPAAFQEKVPALVRPVAVHVSLASVPVRTSVLAADTAEGRVG